MDISKLENYLKINKPEIYQQLPIRYAPGFIPPNLNEKQRKKFKKIGFLYDILEGSRETHIEPYWSDYTNYVLIYKGKLVYLVSSNDAFPWVSAVEPKKMVHQILLATNPMLIRFIAEKMLKEEVLTPEELYNFLRGLATFQIKNLETLSKAAPYLKICLAPRYSLGFTVKRSPSGGEKLDFEHDYCSIL